MSFGPVIVNTGFSFPNVVHSCTLEPRYTLVSWNKTNRKKPTTKDPNDVSGVIWVRYCECQLLFPNIARSCTLEPRYTLVSWNKTNRKKPTTKGPNDVSGVVWARYCEHQLLFPNVARSCTLEPRYTLVSWNKMNRKKTYHQGPKQRLWCHLGPLLWMLASQCVVRR